jgi:hypothetical protein
MRNRLLRHDYFSNEQLFRLVPQDRLIFLGLLCYADREGRLILNKYKLEKFFKGITKIINSIDKLIEVGLIERYVVKGTEYLKIADHIWERQRIFGKEEPSKLPDITEANGLPERQDESGRVAKKKPGPKTWVDPEAFIHFMGYFPKQDWGKMERSRARQQWRQLQADGALPPLEVLIACVRETPPEKLPNPSTFLKYQPWLSSYTPNCAYCDNERVVYGTKPDGSKGLMPCPKCQKTRQTPM